MSEAAALITAIAALVGAVSTPALVVGLMIRASRRERERAARNAVDHTVQAVAGGQAGFLEALIVDALEPETDGSADDRPHP